MLGHELLEAWIGPHVCSNADSLTEQFRLAGHVKMVRICHPNSGPRSTAQTIPGADIAFSRQQHALIEFGSTEDADTAVKTLTANSNW